MFDVRKTLFILKKCTQNGNNHSIELDVYVEKQSAYCTPLCPGCLAHSDVLMVFDQFIPYKLTSLNIDVTYWHKPGTRPPSCDTPLQRTIYTIIIKFTTSNFVISCIFKTEPVLFLNYILFYLLYVTSSWILKLFSTKNIDPDINFKVQGTAFRGKSKENVV